MRSLMNAVTDTDALTLTSTRDGDLIVLQYDENVDYLFSIKFFRLHPPMLAVGSDDTNRANGGKVFIYEYSESGRKWSKTETLAAVLDPVHDIAFAPNMGRSYHLLAIAAKEVRIFTLRYLHNNYA